MQIFIKIEFSLFLIFRHKQQNILVEKKQSIFFYKIIYQHYEKSIHNLYLYFLILLYNFEEGETIKCKINHYSCSQFTLTLTIYMFLR